jgi:hypothetical protein
MYTPALDGIYASALRRRRRRHLTRSGKTFARRLSPSERRDAEVGVAESKSQKRLTITANVPEASIKPGLSVSETLASSAGALDAATEARAVLAVTVVTAVVLVAEETIAAPRRSAAAAPASAAKRRSRLSSSGLTATRLAAAAVAVVVTAAEVVVTAVAVVTATAAKRTRAG